MRYELKKPNLRMVITFPVLGLAAIVLAFYFIKSLDYMPLDLYGAFLFACYCVMIPLSAWMTWIHLSGNYPTEILVDKGGVAVIYKNAKEKRFWFEDIASIRYLGMHSSHGIVLMPLRGKAITFQTVDEETARKIVEEISKNLKNKDEKAEMILGALPGER